ncbi:MAG: monofunctional biosynthetic peptidoglycan transglycosylase [Gammaproteobacteria bacterium]|nr:monofunctional biosynthetic peptidoglycan transglycosylase [Gammaproteobacteria bacterium]
MLTIKRFKLAARWGIRILAALLLIEIGFIWGLMPDWDEFAYGPVPKSRAIKKYEYLQTTQEDYAQLKWQPITLKSLPKHLVRAVIVAEDARFYQHKGLDQEALKKALEYNLSQRRIVYGASTISQQTIKNLFLSPSRNPLRKLHEIILTYLMEQNVGKQRILEIYLNSAEFGVGIYGVEAASQYYFRKSAKYLTPLESVELAASLPAPKNHNPETRTRFFIKKIAKIRRHLQI